MPWGRFGPRQNFTRTAPHRVIPPSAPLPEAQDFLRQAESLYVTPWSVPASDGWYEWVPVIALRWTQSGVDSRSIYGHDEHFMRSVYETPEDVFVSFNTRPTDIPESLPMIFEGQIYAHHNECSCAHHAGQVNYDPHSEHLHLRAFRLAEEHLRNSTARQAHSRDRPLLI